MVEMKISGNLEVYNEAPSPKQAKASFKGKRKQNQVDGQTAFLDER